MEHQTNQNCKQKHKQTDILNIKQEPPDCIQSVYIETATDPARPNSNINMKHEPTNKQTHKQTA